MIERTFYNGTIRRYTIAFGTIFNGIKIHRQNKAGDIIKTIPVPLRYLSKEKFISRAVQLSSISGDETKVKETLPAMGFELINMQYSTVRKTNTMDKIGQHGKFMFNRVPYDFTFGLYIAGRTIDDTLRIVEQILPYFTPELNLSINDMDMLGESSNIPVVIDDCAPEISADGGFEDRRFVQWTIMFTLKGYLYAAQRDVAMIKKTIVDINDFDNHSFFEGYMSQVDPLNAGPNDDHEIMEEITTQSRDSNVITGAGGSDATVDLD